MLLLYEFSRGNQVDGSPRVAVVVLLYEFSRGNQVDSSPRVAVIPKQ